MNGRKVVFRSIVALAVVVAAVAAVRWKMDSTAATEAAEAAVTTEKVGRISIRQTSTPTGRVVSNLDVEIKCRASGEIITLPFDVSDAVKKGDLILELDPVDQQRLLQQSQAALSASRARLAQAEAQLRTAEVTLEADRIRAAANVEAAEAQALDAEAKAKREQQLLERKFSSPEGVETALTTAVQARTGVQTAKAQLESLRAQEIDLERLRQQINLAKADVEADEIALSLSELQLEYTRVYAPIDGVVSARNVQIGQIISSGISNVGGGTAVMVLSDLSRIFVLASVDEADIGFIKIGQDAEMTADSYPGVQFTGKVDRIATNGVNLQNVITFEVRIEVLSENKALLKPEMTTNCTIVIADKKDVLAVPVTSFVREKGQTFVAKPGPGGTKGDLVPVEIGISDSVYTEIISGLQEGDEIVVQDPEAESRWRAGEDQASNDRRGRMMMFRTIGGSSGGRGR
ncbi:MAG: hemolysin D [Candidatus Hydrogenedentota bacterium]